MEPKIQTGKLFHHRITPMPFFYNFSIHSLRAAVSDSLGTAALLPSQVQQSLVHRTGTVISRFYCLELSNLRNDRNVFIFFRYTPIIYAIDNKIQL